MRPLAYSIILALFLAVTQTPPLHADQSEEGDFIRDADRDFVGRLYHYVRSNQDGSRAEQIDVYRASETRIEVMKTTGQCRQAALVIAEINFENWSADTITGGALLPGGEVMEFAFLVRNPATGDLHVEVNLPDQSLAFDINIPATPWHLYDFDLANLTAMTPYLANPEVGFILHFGLMWADPSHPEPVSYMGAQSFTPTLENSDETAAHLRMVSSGEALGDGYLVLDAADGYIIEAAFEVPNHPGYADFQLRLTGIEEIDADGWQQHLVAQFENCDG